MGCTPTSVVWMQNPPQERGQGCPDTLLARYCANSRLYLGSAGASDDAGGGRRVTQTKANEANGGQRAVSTLRREGSSYHSYLGLKGSDSHPAVLSCADGFW